MCRPTHSFHSDSDFPVVSLLSDKEESDLSKLLSDAKNEYERYPAEFVMEKMMGKSNDLLQGNPPSLQ
jgi:hypothetical protein